MSMPEKLDSKYFRSLRQLSRPHRKKIFALLKLFRELDRKIAEFQEISQLKCLSGCGHCCENPLVESSMTELLPIAMYLTHQGQSLKYKEDRIISEKNICTFYKPDPNIPGNGRCTIYPLRPLVCRLFGFASRTDKLNKQEFVTCSKIKTHDPEAYQLAQEMLNNGFPIPKMTDYFMKLYTIDPQHAMEREQINIAFAKALEEISRYIYYRHQEGKEAHE